MKAELISIFSIDVPVSLDIYFPEDEHIFGIWVRANIGSDHSAGCESFDILLCTPGWLEKHCATNGPMWGRHLLIVPRYDYKNIYRFIERYVSSLVADDWTALGNKLSRIGAWEFEDYQP